MVQRIMHVRVQGIDACVGHVREEKGEMAHMTVETSLAAVAQDQEDHDSDRHRQG